VFDVGTGSGILAIAAAKLGASKVDAVDIEPVSVRQSRENLERNGVAEKIQIELGTAGPDQPFTGQYDLVVANIIARVLVEVADGLTAAVADNGTLILSGIIEPREQDVIDRFSALGFRQVRREQMEDWVAHVWRRG
jgi:ribosomal protein L11 methyltransferase